MKAHILPPVPLVLVLARAATQTTQRIIARRGAHRRDVVRRAKALSVVDYLLLHPTVSIKRLAQRLGCSQPTAAKLVASLGSHGCLRELTGYGRNRVWRYQPCVDQFHRDALEALVSARPPAGELP